MKQSSWLLRGLASLSLSLLALAGTGLASRPNAAQTAHGSFSYEPASLTPVTFTDGLGGPFTRSYTVSAPKDQEQSSVDADFKISEIIKVAEDDGTADGAKLNPPVAIDPKSDLYATLAGAISFNPSTAKFSPGSSATIDVKLSSPGYGNFGYYKIKLSALAQKAGVGAGDGSSLLLELRAPDPFEH